MPHRAAASVLVLGVLAAVPAAAQTPAPDPPGPYVVDVRGVSGSVPQDAGFFPTVPRGTIIPSRGLGFDLGGHVYLMQVGAARLGVGANLLRVHRVTSPPATTPSSGTPTPPPPRTIPDVEATLTTVAPQVSFNFGTADGWSYVSAGVGTAQLSTATSGTLTSGALDTGRLSSINAGGGARWFAQRHLAFAFDVRFHLVSAGKGGEIVAGTPRTTLVSAAVGISLR